MADQHKPLHWHQKCFLQHTTIPNMHIVAMRNKAIALALWDDIQDAAGALQVCAGQLSGCEAAVHAMHKIFESPETEAAILVDASNAFNSLNRQSPSITFITYVPHCRRYSPTRIKKISTSTSMGKPSIPKRAPPRESLSPGRKYALQFRDPLLSKPPPGYDSFYGENRAVTGRGELNYDELVIFDHRAIYPRYIIFCQSNC